MLREIDVDEIKCSVDKDGKRQGLFCRYYADSNRMKIYSTGIMKDDMPEGEWSIYLPSGNLYIKANYARGLLHGECRHYFTNGKIQSILPYTNGEVHGACISFYRNGRKKTECEIVDGKLHGSYVTYHSNGQIRVIAFYVKGKKDGDYKSHNKNGILMTHTFFSNGKNLRVKMNEMSKQEQLIVHITRRKPCLIPESV